MMVSVLHAQAQSAIRRVQRIQTMTILWMSVEAGASLSAAWRAHSAALVAFGGDSAIELLSAAVVLWRFNSRDAQEHAEKNASHIAGTLLFVLAAFVVTVSALTMLGYSEPKPSRLGIAVLMAATAIMPWLAWEKRKLSVITGSAALRADAAESALCAYLSLVTLAGIAANAIWHLAWADPLAGLAVVPLILIEGRKAIRGKACGCC
ncbi:MAG: cation transporter [Candidatus Sulfotelmatobacter sp.]